MWLFPGVGRVKLQESAKLSEFVFAQYLEVNFCQRGGSHCLQLFNLNGLFYDVSPLADSDLTANWGRQQLVFMECGPVMRSRPLILVARLPQAWLHYTPSARHQTRWRALSVQKEKKLFWMTVVAGLILCSQFDGNSAKFGSANVYNFLKMWCTKLALLMWKVRMLVSEVWLKNCENWRTSAAFFKKRRTGL